SWSDNPTRTITGFDSTGLPLGPPVTYTNAYTAGLNPLLSPVLPSQTDTTPRNFTWNAGVVRELHKHVQLDLSYLTSPASYLFTVEPFTGAVNQPSFLGLTNTGSSLYHEMAVTLDYKLHRADQIKATYIWSHSRGSLNSLSSVMIPFAAPVIRPNVYGIL